MYNNNDSNIGWGSNKGHSSNNIAPVEISASALRMMDEHSQKEIFFSALRGCHISTIKSLLVENRNLLNAKLFGYEGSDVHEIIVNVSKNE